MFWVFIMSQRSFDRPFGETFLLKSYLPGTLSWSGAPTFMHLSLSASLSCVWIQFSFLLKYREVCKPPVMTDTSCCAVALTYCMMFYQWWNITHKITNYLYFPFYATSYFSSTTHQRQMLYFSLHCICLTAVVTFQITISHTLPVQWKPCISKCGDFWIRM